mmetsp:Transcript_17276/g.31290  ORF Transcript_17276/g.31290 Transcript_17276/m.31290 type:complete len:290 (-) Transcript_17276:354-1223(-)
MTDVADTAQGIGNFKRVFRRILALKRQHLLVALESLLEISLLLTNLGNVRHGDHYIRITRFQYSSFDGKSLLVNSQGGFQITHFMVKVSNLVQSNSNLGVYWTKSSTSDTECFLIGLHCIIVVLAFMINLADTGNNNGNVSVVIPKVNTRPLKKLVVSSHGTIVVTSVVVCLANVENGGGYIDGVASSGLSNMKRLGVSRHCLSIVTSLKVNSSKIVQCCTKVGVAHSSLTTQIERNGDGLQGSIRITIGHNVMNNADAVQTRCDFDRVDTKRRLRNLESHSIRIESVN